MNFRMLTLIAASLAAGGPAYAHHSFSMFDRARTVTINGTIKAFDWINPHAWLDRRSSPAPIR